MRPRSAEVVRADVPVAVFVPRVDLLKVERLQRIEIRIVRAENPVQVVDLLLLGVEADRGVPALYQSPPRAGGIAVHQRRTAIEQLGVIRTVPRPGRANAGRA